MNHKTPNCEDCPKFQELALQRILQTMERQGFQLEKLIRSNEEIRGHLQLAKKLVKDKELKEELKETKIKIIHNATKAIQGKKK